MPSSQSNTQQLISVSPAAISFDFWHTLVAEPDGLLERLRKEAVIHALIAHQIEIEGGLLDARLAAAQALQADAWIRGEHLGPTHVAAYLADTIEGLEGNSHKSVVDAYLGAGKSVELELSPGAASTLAALAGDGMQLGIICDVGLTGSEYLRAILKRASVMHYFRGWAFSDEIGHYKPSTEIFSCMLDQFDLASGNIVWHVGDRRRTDVAGARSSGFVPIRYRGITDDTSDGPEADLVIDNLADLIPLIRDLS
jgi:putative hydrolase of the HAD superfamily